MHHQRNEYTQTHHHAFIHHTTQGNINKHCLWLEFVCPCECVCVCLPHGAQETSPVEAATVLNGHVWHDVGLTQYVLVEHGWHWCIAGLGAVNPMAHGKHAALPSTLLARPGGQSTHVLSS